MIDKIKTCIEITSLDPIQFITHQIVDEETLTHADIISNMIPKREYTPVKGDKIYFVPGCDVPRFKVKQYCEKYNVAIVKYREKANVKFIGAKSIEELFRTRPYYTYYKDVLLKWLDIRPIPIVWDELNKAVRESTSDYVMGNYQIESHLKNLSCKLNSASDKFRIMFKSIDTYNLYLSLESDPELYSQNEILSKINTGKLMTTENYESIKRLFKSTDKENLKLAMETMANCDYQTSCVPLLLLINEFGSEIYNSSTKHHVNFKSLLKFFEINNLTTFDLDDIITSLLKRKLLNKSNLDLLMPIAMKFMTAKSDTDYLTVTCTQIDERIEKGLEENILDENSNTEIVNDIEELNIKI